MLRDMTFTQPLVRQPLRRCTAAIAITVLAPAMLAGCAGESSDDPSAKAVAPATARATRAALDRAAAVQAAVGRWAQATTLPEAQAAAEDARNARFDIRFGSVSMSYVGDAEIIERDDTSHRAVMRASARQTQGRSRVDARVEIQLTSAGTSTNGRLLSTVDVPVLGGQTGQATVKTTTETMIIDFAQRLATMGAAAPLMAA